LTKPERTCPFPFPTHKKLIYIRQLKKRKKINYNKNGVGFPIKTTHFYEKMGEGGKREPKVENF
jgi:hypothetical protein